MREQRFWDMVDEKARKAVRDAVPPFIAYAITTGDPAEQDTVNGTTTQQVKVWLNGVPQTEENKSTVVLPHGMAAPGPNEFWMVLLPNFRPPGVLFLRLA